MSTSRGVIQTSTLITIVTSVIALGAVSYVVVSKISSEKEEEKALLEEKINAQQKQIDELAGQKIQEPDAVDSSTQQAPAPVVQKSPAPVVKTTTTEAPATSNTSAVAPKVEIKNLVAIPGIHSTRISWDTNVKAKGTFTLWPTNTPSGNLVVYTEDTTDHVVTVETIPDKEYHYSVQVIDDKGQKAVEPDRTFTTPVDNVSPKVIGVLFSGNGTLMNMKVETDENAKIKVFYQFHTSGSNGDIKTVTTTGYQKQSDIKISVPTYYEGTLFDYELYAYDESGNETAYGTWQVRVKSISGF